MPKATHAEAARLIERATARQLAAAIKAAKAQPEKFSPEFIRVLELAQKEKENRRAEEAS